MSPRCGGAPDVLPLLLAAVMMTGDAHQDRPDPPRDAHPNEAMTPLIWQALILSKINQAELSGDKLGLDHDIKQLERQIVIESVDAYEVRPIPCGTTLP